MSFILMAQAMKLKVGSTGRKMILLKLCDNASDEGKAWPSYQTIADHCEVSRRTAIRHIETLEEMGVVSTSKRFKDNKSQSNVYQLNLEVLAKGILPMNNGEKFAPPNKPISSARVSLGSDTGSLPDGDGVSLGGDTDSLPSGDMVSPRTNQLTNQLTNQVKPITEKDISPQQPAKQNRASYVLSDHDFEQWRAFGEISDEVLEAWLQVRRSHRAVVTPVVIRQFAKELGDALAFLDGYSVDLLLREVIVANWQSFKAGWLVKRIREADIALVS
jgi:hypothetical protein